MDEYWQCTYKALQFEGGKGPTSIVDDGGDMTLFLIKGKEWEMKYKENGALPDPEKYETEDEKALFKLIRQIVQESPNKFTELCKDVVGISEETTTGVLRLN